MKTHLIEEMRLGRTLDAYFNLESEESPFNSMSAYIATSATLHHPMRRRALMSELDRLGLMICGGTITSLFTDSPVNDLDFYMKDPSKKNEIIKFLKEFFPEIPYQTKNAITFKRPGVGRKVYTVQLITRFSGTAQQIFKDFDFTITNGAFDFTTNRFEFGDRFFPDLSKRTLVYSGNSHYPMCALYRTKKYGERGFKVPGSTLMHIALSIIRLDIRTYGQLKDQIMGVDTVYLADMLNQKRFDDALPVDYAVFVEHALAHMNGLVDDTGEILEDNDDGAIT